MLQTNPFYLLNIPMTASKSVIAAASEAMMLGDGSISGDELLNMLMNPDARIDAELSWFPGEPEETVVAVQNAVRSSAPIDTADLGGLSLLNASLYNFGIDLVGSDRSGQESYLAQKIWDIAETSCRLEPAAVARDINGCRMTAGISPADPESVRTALDRRNSEIGDEICSLLANSVADEVFRDTVSELAEEIVSRGDMRIRMVINGIIDKYEILNLERLSFLEAGIKDIADKVEACDPYNSPGAALLCEKLRQTLAEWTALARPMIVRSENLGGGYPAGTEVRDDVYRVVISIGNEKSFSDHYRKAVELCKTCKQLFSAGSRLAEPFDRIIRREQDKSRKAKEGFLRSGLYRVILGFVAWLVFTYASLAFGLVLSSDVSAGKKPWIFGVALLSAAVFVWMVKLIKKSSERKREYIEKTANGENRDEDVV